MKCTCSRFNFFLKKIPVWQKNQGLEKKQRRFWPGGTPGRKSRIWQKNSTSGTLEPVWELTGKYLPVLPVLPGHPDSEQNADGRLPSSMRVNLDRFLMPMLKAKKLLFPFSRIFWSLRGLNVTLKLN